MNAGHYVQKSIFSGKQYPHLFNELTISVRLSVYITCFKFIQQEDPVSLCLAWGLVCQFLCVPASLWVFNCPCILMPQRGSLSPHSALSWVCDGGVCVLVQSQSQGGSVCLGLEKWDFFSLLLVEANSAFYLHLVLGKFPAPPSAIVDLSLLSVQDPGSEKVSCLLCKDTSILTQSKGVFVPWGPTCLLPLSSGLWLLLHRIEESEEKGSGKFFGQFLAAANYLPYVCNIWGSL